MKTETLARRDPVIQEYFGVWAQSVCSVLEQIGGAPFTPEELPAETANAKAQGLADNGFWTRFEAAKDLKGKHALLLSKADALRLAQILLAQPLTETEAFTDEQRDALGEMFRRFASAAAVSLKGRLGVEVELKFAGMDRPHGAPAARACFQCTSANIPPIVLVIEISPDLASTLASTRSPLSQSHPAVQLEAAPAPTPTRDLKMDLLMGVELDVTLRFGERQMLLRDILELNTGAVVELDRHVQDPAELLVGGKVIARGEVVVVDGNYGLRVTEIVSPMERIESLRR